jgi:hypothetical protein
VRVFGNGDRLAAAVDVEAERQGGLLGRRTSGRIYLEGRPDYDSASRVLGLREFDFDENTTSGLARAAAWLAKPLLVRRMEESLRFPLAEKTDEAKELLRRALENLTNEEMSVSGDVHDVTVEGLFVTPKALEWRLRERRRGWCSMSGLASGGDEGGSPMKNEAGNGARMKERLPSAVHALWGFFAAAGIPAWIVGGCVRDLLLGRSFADVDFVADAPAEVILALVEHWGKKRFGRFEGTLVGKPPAATVLLAVEGTGVEIAPLVGGSLEADLGRRDFTVNAMAMDLKGALGAPFGGRGDLKEKRLRFTGSAADRLAEDPIRALRFCRFAAELAFHPDLPGQRPCALWRPRHEEERSSSLPRNASVGRS